MPLDIGQDLGLFGLHLSMAGEGLRRIARKRFHLSPKLRLMNTKIVCGLCNSNATFFDQLDRLKLELPRTLPSFHDLPPVP